MNPLQEHPHLFANGQFDIFYKPHKKVKRYNSFPTACYDGEELGENHINYGKIRLLDRDSRHSHIAKLEDCVLVARPISDMTESEMQDFLNQPKSVGISDRYLKRYKRMISEESYLNTLSFREARNLLSIGVYPFDESHFEDGTVIDINNI